GSSGPHYLTGPRSSQARRRAGRALVPIPATAYPPGVLRASRNPDPMPTRPSTDSVPAPRPRIAVLPLPAEPTLGTEVPAGLVRAATTAVTTATGGGQVAVVHRDGGSIALWDGDAPRAGPLRVLVGGKP